GITEPALFGVNLKYKFPFFCALIGSGVAAAFAGLMHVTAAALGSAGFLGFLSIYPKTIPMWVVSVLISFAVAFILTYVYGKGHLDRKSTRLNSSHVSISYAVFCLKKKRKDHARNK